jgi:unsaturated rhamnogalacturonyl hydrolase
MPAGRILSLAILGAISVLANDKTAVGLSRQGSLIEATEVRGPSPKLPKVLLIGGLDGDSDSSHAVAGEIAEVQRIPLSRRRFHLVGVALANPSRSPLRFPPEGTAYRENTESHYLSRWIGMQAPDLVIVAGRDDFGLTDALARKKAAGVGTIPARRADPVPGLLKSLTEVPASAARLEMESRLRRKPRELADELAAHYGHNFDDAVYIPAVALIGRIRLGQIDDVQRIVSPFVNGSKNSLAKPSGSHLSGHLVFAELARRTGDSRYVELVRKAADLGFSETGEMKEAMPMHSEMSDAVFMACPILASAGRLTAERKYFDMARRHYAFMAKLCVRADGLYRHSPLDESAWGRGNAFPALGLAWTLSDMPKDHPGFDEMLAALRKHLQVLSGFQDESGMWRQVIDKPGSYRELSATAMIGTAMLRALRKGWIDERTYKPRIDAAWRAILARSRDGVVVDVCESTGKQKSLQDYLNRAAVVDRDARGGAMALLFATEMAGLQ